MLAIARNYEALCTRSAEKIVALVADAIRRRGCFSAALCGGNTPQGIYELLGSPSYQKRLDWTKVDFFLGDERWVPLVHPRSNFKMITQALGPLSLCLHPVQTAAASPQVSAQLYEEELQKYFKLQPGPMPVFDLVLLGVGEDGHTASLFPGHSVLSETTRLVAAVEAPGLPEPRVTLTLPVINHARTVLFVVSGPAKAVMLQKVLSNPSERSLPAQLVRPGAGEMWWFVDEAAAKLC